MSQVDIAHGPEREDRLLKELLTQENRRLAELADQHRWISTVERTPMMSQQGKGATHPLVAAIHYKCGAYQKTLARQDENGWFDDKNQSLNVVYWMPLPNMPQIVDVNRKVTKTPVVRQHKAPVMTCHNNTLSH